MLYFYYYHKDETGREWGPITVGQRGDMHNRGVLTNQSLMRPEGIDEWFLYQACPTYPRNKKEDAQNGTHDTRHTYPNEETEKTAFAMETDIMRRRVAATLLQPATPAPVSFDVNFAESTGIVYAGWENLIEPTPGTRLRYQCGEHAKIHLDLCPNSLPASDEDIVLHLEKAQEQVRLRAEFGLYPNAQGALSRLKETIHPNGTQRHVWHVLQHNSDEEFYKIYHEITVTWINGYFLQTWSTYPQYLETLVRVKLDRFLTLAVDAVNR